MLQLRLITPADRTEDVTALLDGTVGTTNLIVLRGAACEPAGDVVSCDVAREAADELLDELREFGIDGDGSITLQDIAVSLSERVQRAEHAVPGDPADAVLWESLTEVTQEESTLSFTYLAFLAVATMIAACGVVLDNAILIVGAMAVGPEFGPLAGVSTALVQRSPRQAGRSLLALVVGFAAAMALTAGFALLMDAAGMFEEPMLERERPETSFIWQPDPVSFVVAFLAGIAGTLSLTSAKSGALVGVAISVTTVPSAANAAVAIAYGSTTQAQGSGQQLLTNLGGIILAGVLTLLVQKFFWARAKRRERALMEEGAGHGQ
ncbi:MAG TPA: hypothetical protein DEQ61_17705 [Streptomyces sp.]|nr:hypothetical protein [Streptomyces sp.]